MSYYRTARDLIAKLVKNYEENAIHAALLQHQIPNPTGEKVQRLWKKINATIPLDMQTARACRRCGRAPPFHPCRSRLG